MNSRNVTTAQNHITANAWFALMQGAEPGKLLQTDKWHSFNFLWDFAGFPRVAGLKVKSLLGVFGDVTRINLSFHGTQLS